MKKIIRNILVLATVLLVGSTAISTSKAETTAGNSYWENYFKENPIVQYRMCGNVGLGILPWENKEIDITSGYGCGGDQSLFDSSFYTSKNMVFTNVENVQATISNTNVISSVEIKEYDFSVEKKAIEDFKAEYNSWSLEQLNTELNKIGENIEGGYLTKPNWWKFADNVYDFETEPDWWEVYGWKYEPMQAVEVIVKGKDLGKSTITLSADGKPNITLDYAISLDAFTASTDELYSSLFPLEALTSIIENADKYADILRSEYHVHGDASSDTDMSNLVNALKGKDIKVYFDGFSNYKSDEVGYIDSSITLNGKDIKVEVGSGFTYYNNVSTDTSVNKDKIDSLVDYPEKIYIDFKYHGDLPAPYTMSINVVSYLSNLYFDDILASNNCPANNGNLTYGTPEYEAWDACNTKSINEANQKAKAYLNTHSISLLYYNPDTNQMETIKENLSVSSDGKVNLTFNHFSSYVLAGKEGKPSSSGGSSSGSSSNSGSSSDTNTTPSTPDDKTDTPNVDNKPIPPTNNAQTSSINVIIYIGGAVASLLAIVYLIRSKRKKA